MLIYQCEDSVESIFTAVYNSYAEKRDPGDTMLCLDDELYLFAEYVKVVPDLGKTVKVIRTLRRRFGDKDYDGLCFALSSPDDGKAQAVYRTIAAGLSGKCAKGHLFDNLADDDVNKAFKLSRSAEKEFAHLRGFTRFAELSNGILYAKIAPRNNLLTFLMPHFADRFSGENFVLQDGIRGLYGVHPAGQNWYPVQYSELSEEGGGLSWSAEELRYRELFRHFCRSITIEERRNWELQRNMLPLRFREYMVEF